MRRVCALIGCLAFCAVAGWAQQEQGIVDGWLSMVNRTQAEQPHWATPLVTAPPALIQQIRFDALRQMPTLPTATGDALWNFGAGRGLQVIPQRHLEFDVSLPPYLQHNNPKLVDGFGDESFIAKYRIAAANEQHGNYVVTFFLAGSIPTGSYKNGSVAAAVTPTLGAGKGWGKFDVQSTLGAALPVTNQRAVGHAIVWNTTFQYHVARFFWPELETNATFYKDTISSTVKQGDKQLLLTPGLVLGKFPIHNGVDNRLAFIFGAGMQIAATRFHTYDHGLVLTARLPF
jgi:hypothetical protein